MKIKKFNESQITSYIYEIYDKFNDQLIGNYDDYEVDFDCQDLKDTVRFLMEVEEDNKGKDRFEIRKVIYEVIDKDEINKLKIELKADKYNL